MLEAGTLHVTQAVRTPGISSSSQTVREFVYMRRDASSCTFSRWRMRCAQPIHLSYHPGLVEGSIFSRPGVLPTVPSEIFGQGEVKATESHLTIAHFWAINEFTVCAQGAEYDAWCEHMCIIMMI